MKNENRKVHIIEPTIISVMKEDKNTKKKVSAYCRVSTDHFEQQTSYEAQVLYYKNYISKRDDYIFGKIYADEGITGTSTKNRVEFNKMIDDALNGEIDIILTKSISRFARNTIDSLKYIRLLKEKNVAVYFEKENINTLDPNGDLLITILSGMAQEESRSISTNCKWGFKRKFEKGEILLPTKFFLGYTRNLEGEIIIVEEEAKVITEIYTLYLKGYSYAKIRDYLNNKGYKTPKGNKKWSAESVSSILKNEKYKGCSMLQKTYSIDFLNKTRIKNDGQVPKYYVEDSHPKIIDEVVWEKVQAERNRRNSIIKKADDNVHKGKFSSKYALSEIFFCGCCGKNYKRVVWHNYSPKKAVWRCSNRLINGKNSCENSITVDESVLHKKIVCSINILIDENKFFRDTFFRNVNSVLENDYIVKYIKVEEYSDLLVRHIIKKVVIYNDKMLEITFINDEKYLINI